MMKMMMMMVTRMMIPPNDAERLEIKLGVWFEVLVRQPVEGDVHMRYLLIRIMIMMPMVITLMMMMMTSMIVAEILMTSIMTTMMATTWWRRMDHSDGWYSFCWCEPLHNL